MVTGLKVSIHFSFPEITTNSGKLVEATQWEMEKNDLCHTEHFLKTLSSFIKLEDWAKSNSEFGLEEILLLSLIHCDMRKA